MHQTLTYNSSCTEDTMLAGREIAGLLEIPACVYLDAGMGMGKTTLCKAIINGLGYQGAVTSPTYNLIQEYHVKRGIIYHMDLYRLEDAGELEFLALNDLWNDNSLFLIEWPENGFGMLPPADYLIDLTRGGNQGPDQRVITLSGTGL